MGKPQEASRERCGCKFTPFYSILLVALLSSLLVFNVHAQGPFVGSINSDKYHYLNCYWAYRINPENEIWFIDAADAVSYGYVPCNVCKPPFPSSSIPTPTLPPTSSPAPTSTLYPLPEEDQINAFVNNVIDGDTFDTADGYRIWFTDIDAPEFYEPGYLEFKEYLESLVENKIVFYLLIGFLELIHTGDWCA